MRVFLIRHGSAEAKAPRGEDRLRALTPHGIEETRRVARRLRTLGVSFARLLTSPYRRARQTADILAGEGIAAAVESTSLLAPSGDFTEIVALLTGWRDREGGPLALVGHEPELSRWTELLIAGEARGGIVLHKAGVIALELPAEGPLPGACRLLWLTSPKTM